jgi:SagB-type dehydrogenase family enzyme
VSASMSGSIDLLYRFEKDVGAVKRDGQRITLDVTGWKPLSFTAATTAHADAIQALGGEGVTLGRFEQLATGAASPSEARKATSYYIERLSRPRLLTWDLADEKGQLLARVTSLSGSYRPSENSPPTQPLSLCRFAYLRNGPAGVVIESGLTRARVSLEPRGMALLSQSLAQPRPASQDAFAAMLWRLGFFDVATPWEDDFRRTWEFHDLLMHESSRFNRDAPNGGTYRFRGKFPSPPAVKPTPAGTRIELPPVDPDAVGATSASLHAVQQRRQSVRSYAGAAIALPTLGEFLWRVGRTKSCFSTDTGQDLMMRPYPAGGAVNELEFYVAVRRCEGLEPSFYHYDSHGHALVRLEASEKIAATIVERSAAAMAMKSEDQRPDLTIVVSSRLPRLAWKYEGMAYRASLLHAGVLIQLMYLVATDMKLAPCANGSGDSRLFEQATGLDRFEEVSIAEFCLGLPATS